MGVNPTTDRHLQILPNPDAELGSLLERWFAVSGDMDDFIFYNDEPEQSER